MITAKEIREVKFTRSMGGYKTTEVDEFLDRCADAVDEFARMSKETERKMQVLAETVMDYRGQEDGIRTALMSAQRMGESVLAEARKQADEILEAARAEAAAMREKALTDTAQERDELRRVKQEVADFKSKLLGTYREHLTMIGILENNSGAHSAPAASAAHAAPAPPEPERAEAPAVATHAVPTPQYTTQAAHAAPVAPTGHPVHAAHPAHAAPSIPVSAPVPAHTHIPQVPMTAPAPVPMPMTGEMPVGRPIPYAMPDFTSFELIDSE